MKRWVLLGCALVVALTFSGTALAAGKHGLQLYTTTVDATKAQELAQAGYDIASSEAGFAGVELEIVLSPRELAKLRREGLTLQVTRDNQGRSQTQRFALQSANGFNVWRSWD